MAADDDCDLVQSGRDAYCGTRRTSSAVVKELIWACAISVSYRDGLPTPTTYYTINATGRAMVRRPEIEQEIFAAMKAGMKFSVVNDRVIPADDVFSQSAHGQSGDGK